MAAYSNEGTWSFPNDLPNASEGPEDYHKESELRSEQPQLRARRMFGTAFGAQPTTNSAPSPPPSAEPEQDPTPPLREGQHPKSRNKRRRAHYPPRTCRICLDVVMPTFHTDENTSSPLSAFTRSREPPVTYTSAEGGRLLSPCKCKGSQKYVHEDCLRSWRIRDPTQKRNFWECPTCRYRYHLQRLTWSRWIGSTMSQVALTLLIFVLAMFALGFVADPIINLYLDPVSTIASGGAGPTGSLFDDDVPPTWAEHFTKGLATLGLLGFAKYLITIGPWRWFNMRGLWIGGGRGTGRDRIQQLGLATVLIGVATFLFAVWKGVRAFCRKTLESAGERVMDVPGVGDDEDDDDEANDSNNDEQYDT